MTTLRGEAANDSLPSPFPEGWYFVASPSPCGRPSLFGRRGWVKKSSRGVTKTGVSAFPRPTARISAPIWNQRQVGAYVPAGLFVPSMVTSTMPPASASPLPTPTRQGPRSCGSSRHGNLPDWSSRGGESGDGSRNGTCTRTRRSKPVGATKRSRPCAFPAIPRRQRRTLWTWPTFATSMVRQRGPQRASGDGRALPREPL